MKNNKIPKKEAKMMLRKKKKMLAKAASSKDQKHENKIFQPQSIQMIPDQPFHFIHSCKLAICIIHEFY